MKSIASILTLGFLLIGSHVSAAPQAPEATSTTDVEVFASTSEAEVPASAADQEVPASIESNAAEGNASVPAEVASAEFEADSSFSGQLNLRKMTRKYHKYIRSTLRKRGRGHKCTLDKLTVRREWGSMSRRERIRYTDAVKCLYSKTPPLSNPANVPGARNRLDDFVASHIQQGQNIHFDGYLFAWHRNFVYLYEQALRKECRYRGPTPYWDWTLNPDDPRNSPVFDGSATSMSGNGEFVPSGGTYVTAFGLNLTLPPGTGGGCVKGGPFANLQVNLGLTPTVLPVTGVDLTGNLSTTGAFASADEESVSAFRASGGVVNDALQYNPRCLTRDINLFWSNQVRVKDVEFLLSCDNVDCLEKRSDGWEFDQSQPQPLLHAAGHFSVGGLQNDPFASPGDPVFYLHHASFDRVYSIWQAQDPGKRVLQVGGTKTPFNIPPSGPVTLDDSIDFGAISGSVKVRDVLSTIDGPYCYMYD